MKPWCSAAVAEENPLSVFRLAPSTWAAEDLVYVKLIVVRLAAQLWPRKTRSASSAWRPAPVYIKAYSC